LKPPLDSFLLVLVHDTLLMLELAAPKSRVPRYGEGAHEHINASKPDEDVHDARRRGTGTEECGYEVKLNQTDESPVQRSNDDQGARHPI
jgi:hypothetical protein